MMASASATSAWRPALLVGTLLLVAGALTVQGLAARLPSAEWLRAFWSPNAGAMPEMMVHYSWLPRLLTAWICGAALALSGTIFQQILRNPLPWRWPRMLAALTAGAMLAAAGTLLQRLTGNPMASPEVLGISAGAALGLVVLIFALPGAERWLQIVAGSVGALLALGGVLGLARRSAFSPERLLLAGITLGALFDALVVALTATDDPRAGTVLAWLTGSTYRLGAADAITTAAAAIGLGLIIPLLARWAAILPLGGPAAQGLGVDLAKSRFAILLTTAALSAAATLVVGPLTFVGLIAPHLARTLGFQRALWQIAAAALIGALIMVAADWLGRTILFPRQVPAGLIASLIGAPYFMWRMRRA